MRTAQKLVTFPAEGHDHISPTDLEAMLEMHREALRKFAGAESGHLVKTRPLGRRVIFHPDDDGAWVEFCYMLTIEVP
jgi:predicted transcriptional regulator of viral defense system